MEYELMMGYSVLSCGITAAMYLISAIERYDHIITDAVTVTLTQDIVRKPDELKRDEETSYEEVIALIVEEAYDDAWLTEEEKQEVLQSLAEVEAGNYYTHEEIKEMIDQKTT